MGTSRYILVVGHDPGMAWLMKSSLKEQDREVVVVGDIENALLLARSVRFDLALFFDLHTADPVHEFKRASPGVAVMCLVPFGASALHSALARLHVEKIMPLPFKVEHLRDTVAAVLSAVPVEPVADHAEHMPVPPVSLTGFKVVSQDVAADWSRRFGMSGRTVVLANGCFDVLHIGHIRYLEDAKSRGDFLIVGVNSDSTVRALKGKGRPLYPEQERAALLAALACVDKVVIFEEATASDLMRAVRPNIHAKGTDYNPDNYPELDALKEVGAKFVVCGDAKTHDATAIVKALRKTK